MATDQIELIVGAALVAGGLFVAFRHMRRELNGSKKAGATAISTHQPVAAVRPRPRGQLEILSPTQLFETTGTLGLVEVIRNRLALTDDNWRRDALPVLERFAEFVQLLPASQSHHHAQPGGLLVHTMEVASFALTIRQGKKLPAGAAPEEQVQLAAVWSFAVLLGALLHDIGKPVSDVTVELFGADEHVGIGAWPALAGAMNLVPGATHYEVDFPNGLQRDYATHQRLAVVLLHALVPDATLRWLSRDPGLLPALIEYLDGKESVKGAAIAEIIKEADSLSVADNLKSGPRTRFAKAKQPPLIERLMWGLRTLAKEGLLAVNRPGAALYLDPDGEHVWAVAGVLADKVRSLLNEREIRTEGFAAIPTDNTRLFDTWLEYGALVQPSKDVGKGSVWWVKVEIADWSQVLTVLKFRVKDVFEAGATPRALDGSVTPVSPSSTKKVISEEQPDETDLGELQPDQTPINLPGGAVSGAAGDATDDFMSMVMGADATGNQSHVAAPSNSTPAAKPQQEYLDASDQAVSVIGRSATAVNGKTVQALSIPSTPPKAKYKPAGAKERPNADAFMSWVQKGLGTGTLSYNESESAVHFTNEGMALVSPKLMKLYLEEHSYIGDRQEGQSELQALQNDLQRGGYIKKTAQNTNFVQYAIKQADGSVGNAKLNTYVIDNPQAYIRPVPSPNPLLVLIAASPKKPTIQAPAAAEP